MADNKITYNVPLRKEFLKAPKYKRAKKAVKALKQFVSKHMKTENVKIGRHANMKLWERGCKRPPHHLKVEVTKEDDHVTVELEGKKYEKVEAQTVEEKGKLQEMVEKVTGKAAPKKVKKTDEVKTPIQEKPVVKKSTADSDKTSE